MPEQNSGQLDSQESKEKAMNQSATALGSVNPGTGAEEATKKQPMNKTLQSFQKVSSTVTNAENGSVKSK